MSYCCYPSEMMLMLLTARSVDSCRYELDMSETDRYGYYTMFGLRIRRKFAAMSRWDLNNMLMKLDTAYIQS